jgi:hypothetical protein
MNEKLIDFPPWRKNRDLLQDLALLPKDLVFLAQPRELLDDILMRTFEQIAMLVLGTPPA